jgi:chitin synthase
MVAMLHLVRHLRHHTDVLPNEHHIPLQASRRHPFLANQPRSENFEYINLYISDIGGVTVVFCGAASFGVYIAAGFLHLDPWHIFTSYAQYLFVLSSYTNILNIYAFSNFNDHSWDHKGSRPAPIVTASAVSKPTSDQQDKVVEEVDLPQADIDAHFGATVKRALTPYVPPMRSKDLTADDEVKMF